MKRRTFLKTVGTAAGAAALGGSTQADQQPHPDPRSLARVESARSQPPLQIARNGLARTYGLEPETDPTGPFTLKVRPAGWFPDGAPWVDPNGTPQKRLFLEEVAGKKKPKPQKPQYESFPIPNFGKTDEASKKWVLGSKLAKPDDHPEDKPLTQFVRNLAVLMRQYNASFYRLRRLHFYWDYRDPVTYPPNSVVWPPSNPDGNKPGTPNPSDANGFQGMVNDAEKDWINVTNKVSDFLTTATDSGYLKAADMIAVNGYVMSMRVVVATMTKEVCGSSSHVSISSPFSSSSP